MNQFMKLFNVALSERRLNDAWVDFSLRQLRDGPVEFYRAKDINCGIWLFKVCHDTESGKMAVKAVKCPPGRVFAQLEGNSMVFQRSLVEGYLYDVVSLSYVDESGRTKRRLIKTMDEIPDTIKRNFQLMKYREATGKETPLAEHFVTLTKISDCKSAIVLFILERAWPLLPMENLKLEADDWARETSSGRGTSQEDRALRVIRRLEKAPRVEVEKHITAAMNLDTSQVAGVIEALAAAGRIIHLDPEHVKVQRRRRQATDAYDSSLTTSSESNVSPDLMQASST